MAETSAAGTAPDAARARRRGAAFALCAMAALLGLEALAFAFVNDALVDFECGATGYAALCDAAGDILMRGMACAAVLAMVAWARPASVGLVLAAARARPGAGGAAVNLAGFALVMAPFLFLHSGLSAGAFGVAMALWLGGAALMALGAGAAAAPLRAWGAALRLVAPAFALAAPAALLAPEIIALVGRAVSFEAISGVTYGSALAVLSALGEDVVAKPGAYELGIGGFVVLVSRECSGIEGFALITGFMTLYLAMFRDRLRFPHALVLIPVGLALSWALNVVRIAALILIGAHVSPDLAADGFHSHAGWLMFTLLSLSLAAAAHGAPWLRRARPAAASPAGAAATVAPPPLREDWNAARLLPFIAFMASALLASTFLATPELGYPVRFAITLGALLYFRRLLSRIDWRPEPLAPLVGVAIGIAWTLTGPAPDVPSPLVATLASAPAWVAFVWVGCRLLGTSLLVPLVEELTFRSYLLERLNLRDRLGAVAGAAVAIGASTALFAALHDRWFAAALAGLVFAAFALRRGRIADAVWCHAAANAVIAAAALASGRWDLI